MFQTDQAIPTYLEFRYVGRAWLLTTLFPPSKRLKSNDKPKLTRNHGLNIGEEVDSNLSINSTVEDFRLFQESMISPAMVLDIMVPEVILY
jgi:hypothetical protein